MAGRQHFLTQAGGLVASVRGSRRKPAVDAIRLPGDRSRRVRAERLERGVPVREGTWRELGELAKHLGVAVPSSE